MSTEVANRIGRVRRSLHDRRKKGRERKARKEKRPLPSFPNSLFFLPSIPLPSLSSPPPFFYQRPHGMRSLFALHAHFRRFFSLSLNKPPARQAIKLTLKIRSTKMKCLEIARDIESLFFLITPLDCSGGVASLLHSPINRFCR